MYAKFCIVKLLIVASIIAHCDSGTNPMIQTIFKEVYKEALAYKPTHCFAPGQLDYECGVTKYPNPDNELVRWTYDSVAKSCIPLYMPRNQKNCPNLEYLPYTQKECDIFCGELCTVTYSNNKTEPGICMLNCHIPIPEGVPLPCPPGSTRCCPRGYQYSTTSTTTTENPIVKEYGLLNFFG